MATPEEQQPIVLTGSCECRAVTYYSTALPTSLRNCHCRICRKLAAGPYLTFAIFSDSSILVFENDFHTSPILNTLATGAHRGQCDCGTLLFLRYHGALEDDEVGVVASTIDEGSIEGGLPKPDQHIFVKEKASWFDLPSDGAARHEDYPKDFKDSPNALSRRDTGEANPTVQRISDAVFDPFWSLTDGQFSTLEPFVVKQRLKNLEREIEGIKAINWEGDRGKLLEGITKLERSVRGHLDIWRRDALSAMEAIDHPKSSDAGNQLEYGTKELRYEGMPKWRMKGAEAPPRPRQWVRKAFDNARKSGEWNKKSSSDTQNSVEWNPRGTSDARSSRERSPRSGSNAQKFGERSKRSSDDAQNSRGWVAWGSRNSNDAQNSGEENKESSVDVQHSKGWVSWESRNCNEAQISDELKESTEPEGEELKSPVFTMAEWENRVPECSE